MDRSLVGELSKCRDENSKMNIELHQSKLEILKLNKIIESYEDNGLKPGFIIGNSFFEDLLLVIYYW